jgi:hypothetical protein
MTSEEIQDAFARTLTGNCDDESPWEAVGALRRLGSREVFDEAVNWCASDTPIKRARGADVLAQLGRTVEHRATTSLKSYSPWFRSSLDKRKTRSSCVPRCTL